MKNLQLFVNQQLTKTALTLGSQSLRLELCYSTLRVVILGRKSVSRNSVTFSSESLLQWNFLKLQKPFMKIILCVTDSINVLRKLNKL